MLWFVTWLVFPILSLRPSFLTIMSFCKLLLLRKRNNSWLTYKCRVLLSGFWPQCLGHAPWSKSYIRHLFVRTIISELLTFAHIYFISSQYVVHYFRDVGHHVKVLHHDQNVHDIIACPGYHSWTASDNLLTFASMHIISRWCVAFSEFWRQRQGRIWSKIYMRFLLFRTIILEPLQIISRILHTCSHYFQDPRL